ncbi:MAG: WG repeat-containing protein [Clostridiales bacterium]|nr:WG repeat-containing protein [Clostridiales bacterium]
MKRYLLSSFICILILFTCACEEQEPMLPEDTPDINEPQIEFSQPAFSLEDLPDLEPFETPREIVNRYFNEEFADTLKPAADYGRLYPYAGSNSSRYGLVDARGRIVVDPFYGEAYYAEPANGGEPEYLVLAYPVDEEEQKLWRVTGGGILLRRFAFAAADGSWLSDTFYGIGARLSEGRIIIHDYDNPQDANKQRVFRIYDLKGQLIAQGEGELSGFQEGLSVVWHFIRNEQNGKYQEYYDYIDKNGNVVIPGPFLEAEGFANGFANVVIVENERRVIDTQGNTRRRSRPGEIRYDTFGEYICFTEYAANTRCGILDKNGDVIIDLQYNEIRPSIETGSTLMVGMKEDGSYWIIDPQRGEESKIELAGVHINHADILGNNWCEVSYVRDPGNGELINGFALLKDRHEYRFDSDEEPKSCSNIQGDLFAISTQNRLVNYTEIFDAAIGKVIRHWDDFYFSHKLNDVMLVFSTFNGSRQLVFDTDLKPAFSTDDLGGGHIKNIQYLADDIYSIRTTFYSGLIKENGQWLIRVYANNMD